MHTIIWKQDLTLKHSHRNSKTLETPWRLQSNHKKHAYEEKTRSLIPPWRPRTDDFKTSMRLQSRSSPIVIHTGLIRTLSNSSWCCSLLCKYIVIVLCKNLLHPSLYAFMTSTRTSLRIFSQKISLHSNQILCTTHEQSDFWTSISYFLFFFFSSFLFFLPLYFLFLFYIFTTSSSSNPCPKYLLDKFYAIWGAPYIRDEEVPHKTPRGSNSWHPIFLTHSK